MNISNNIFCAHIYLSFSPPFGPWCCATVWSLSADVEQALFWLKFEWQPIKRRHSAKTKNVFFYLEPIWWFRGSQSKHLIFLHVFCPLPSKRFEWPQQQCIIPRQLSLAVSVSFYVDARCICWQSVLSGCGVSQAASAADGKDVYLMPNITRGGKPSIKLFINSARI